MEINEYIFDGIPLTTYEKNNDTKKPLIFFFHGFTGDKDKNIMGRGEKLADMGFFVVAMDAYLHGQRMPLLEKQRSNLSKYEDIIEIAIHTANDAKTLYHKYFKHLNQVDANGFYVYGVSMGSLSAFYLATTEPLLKALVALVPTPSFVAYYKEKAESYGFNHGFSYERKLAFYETIDPLLNYEKMQHCHIFIGVGKHDQVVNPTYAIELQSKLNHVILKTYDTGHDSTPEMLQHSYAFLKEAMNQ